MSVYQAPSIDGAGGSWRPTLGVSPTTPTIVEPAVTAGRRQSEWVGWLDVIGHSNAPSDRGFVRPQRTSHRLVDDGDVGRSTAL